MGDYNEDLLVINKGRSVFRRLDLLGSRADLLLEVLNNALSLPGALVLLNVLALVPEDFDGREPLHLVLCSQRPVLLLVCVNLSKNDRWVVLAERLGRLLILKHRRHTIFNIRD
jgi:hypothetical protein